jgi:hypothetical protein
MIEDGDARKFIKSEKPFCYSSRKQGGVEGSFEPPRRSHVIYCAAIYLDRPETASPRLFQPCLDIEQDVFHDQ